eukprot:NODE_76_length_23837_cov_1.242396.p10 type:complete len:226 gc:universal NODE_76_length_23837_cov_1.242396:12452-13129(+)
MNNCPYFFEKMLTLETIYMFDNAESQSIFQRTFKKTNISKDVELNNAINKDSEDYLNGLTDYQILQLKKEMQGMISDDLNKKLSDNTKKSEETKENIVIDQEKLDVVKEKYKSFWEKPTKSNPFLESFDLPTIYTEDQLLTAISSNEPTLIAHSLGELISIGVTNWDVLTSRLLPLLVHRSKMVRFRAYDILYIYESLPVMIIELLQKSTIDGHLTKEILAELQS